MMPDNKDNTLHLWKVILSYRYASKKNKATLYIAASSLNTACDIALNNYDIHSQDWPTDKEPFILSAKLVSWYITHRPE